MSEPNEEAAQPGGTNFGLRALAWAWKNYDSIKVRVQEVRDWFRGGAPKQNPERGILIIGPGGAGKTTLARIISGDFDWLTSDPWEYGESYGVEQYEMADDPGVSVVVPPGQVQRRGGTWAEHEQAIASGKYRGVILVGAFGFESLPQGIGYKDHPLFSGDVDTFRKNYLAHCREGELSVLQRIGPALKMSPKPIWLLCAVTKEDLWYARRKEFIAQYNQREYANAVESIRIARGDARFRYELLTLALVISNLKTKQGETLWKNSEGYDQRQQVEGVRRLFEVLKSLLEWEGNS